MSEYRRKPLMTDRERERLAFARMSADRAAGVSDPCPPDRNGTRRAVYAVYGPHGGRVARLAEYRPAAHPLAVAHANRVPKAYLVFEKVGRPA